MKKKVWMIFLIMAIPLTSLWSQQEKKSKLINISGFITDGRSAETLIGASVMDKISNRGIATNVYGYYTLNVPVGEIQLQVSYIGYETQVVTFIAVKDTVIHVSLTEGNLLNEVVVTAGREFKPTGSTVEFSPIQIKTTPVAFGEADVLKTLQAVPGVQAGVEGTSGFYVRGGGADQNLFLLDGVPVYNVGHVMGLFSIFNGDAVKKVTLHKGSFPARFGGRLSSVVDIRLKDGDMQKYHGSFNIGLLSGRLNLEGPIIKGKTSFNFSARRSYLDLFTRLARLATDEMLPDLYLYDLNAKVNHKFSDKSRLYLSFYKGKDNISATSKHYDGKSTIGMHWGNTIGSARWNYVFSNKLFMNATVAYNEYKYDLKSTDQYRLNEGNKITAEVFQFSGIRDYSMNLDFEYMPVHNHQIRMGGGILFHKFSPEVHGSRFKGLVNDEEQGQITKHFLNDEIAAREASLYIEDEFGVTDKLKANLGGHFSLFDVQGKTYLSAQPRVSLGYQLTDNWSLKSSYTRMNQYIHLLSNSMLSLPTDLWVPVTKNLKPMNANQFTGGIHYDTHTGYDISVEGFYKQMNNLLEYKDGSGWGDAYSSWETQVESGKGWSYGAELYARKTLGRLTGTLGYTLAWNYRQFETINHGRRFNAKYDRRHDVNISLAYEISKKVDISSSWTYGSGNTATLPLEEYPAHPGLGEIGNGSSWGWSNLNLSHVETRNNFRLPPTHHLDLNVNYYRSPNRIWSFSVYNLYNRANPYVVYPGYAEKSGRYTLIQYSFYQIIPSVSFTCKF